MCEISLVSTYADAKTRLTYLWKRSLGATRAGALLSIVVAFRENCHIVIIVTIAQNETARQAGEVPCMYAWATQSGWGDLVSVSTEFKNLLSDDAAPEPKTNSPWPRDGLVYFFSRSSSSRRSRTTFSSERSATSQDQT